MSCLFCRIIRKELGSEVAYEDEDTLAFKDIHPRAPVHLLLVPKVHFNSLKDDKAEEAAKELMAVAKKIAQERNLAGYKLVFNVGREAGQTIEHLHLHLLSGGPSELTI